MAQRPSIHLIAGMLAAVGLLLALSAADAGAQLVVIQLDHRPAEEVIPVIAPLLDPADRISGQGYRLFVNTNPENVSRIREIVAHLDRAAGQLAITVVQGEHALESLSALDLSGKVTIGGGVGVGVGDPGRGPDDDSVQVDARHHRHASRVSDIQRVLVQNGGTALITVGLSAPVVMGSPRRQGRASHQVVEYRQTATGIQVTPRVSGDRLTLTVDARRGYPSDDGSATVKTQQVQTMVQGRLNEWIDLGAILAASPRREFGPGSGETSHRSGRAQVFVRVETAP